MSYYPPVSPYAAGLGCKCPRCGQGPLFDGYLKLRKDCEQCQLDYAKADSGDGPAVFVIFIVGFAAVAMAFVARYVLYAPIGVALFISMTFAIGSILLIIRPLKATMIALQYANKASEGRLEE
ncbi:DUF983 domain-containing protein [Hyphococcus sp. DH-69]|uniref:DUF983 domain-containing protein n=1 Tax=Hyphococcus formosus TaxID=3143534 RepID=UPI00398B6B9C